MQTLKALSVAVPLVFPSLTVSALPNDIETLKTVMPQSTQTPNFNYQIEQQHAKEITMQSMTLNTQVGPIAANLYLPEGNNQAPLIVVTGAWTSVKEQMPAVYAKALADKGYAALTFDFRGWGETQRIHSQTQPFVEDPAIKTQDIIAVLQAANRLEGVDTSRIGGLAICASAGYMLDAALESSHLQSVAVVAPWLHDKAMAADIYGGEESTSRLIALAREAKQQNEPQLIEAASLENDNALMYQVPYYTENNRGLVKEYDNQFNVASWEQWLTYDAQQSALKQEKPVLMVASEAMALPQGAHQYLSNAGGNVKAIWLEGITQFDFYDQPKAVNTAVQAVTEHFNHNL